MSEVWNGSSSPIRALSYVRCVKLQPSGLSHGKLPGALTGSHLLLISPYLFLGFSSTMVPAPALCSGSDVSSPLLVFTYLQRSQFHCFLPSFSLTKQHSLNSPEAFPVSLVSCSILTEFLCFPVLTLPFHVVPSLWRYGDNYVKSHSLLHKD